MSSRQCLPGVDAGVGQQAQIKESVLQQVRGDVLGIGRKVFIEVGRLTPGPGHGQGSNGEATAGRLGGRLPIASSMD